MHMFPASCCSSINRLLKILSGGVATAWIKNRKLSTGMERSSCRKDHKWSPRDSQSAGVRSVHLIVQIGFLLLYVLCSWLLMPIQKHWRRARRQHKRFCNCSSKTLQKLSCWIEFSWLFQVVNGWYWIRFVSFVFSRLLERSFSWRPFSAIGHTFSRTILRDFHCFAFRWACSCY